MPDTAKNTFREETIDFGELLLALYRKMILITAITLLCGLAGFFISKFALTPKYEADAMMLVNSGDRGIDYVTGEQISSSANLVNVYGLIIKSDMIMNEVYDELIADDVEIKKIFEIRVEPVQDTPVMQLSVISDDYEFALRFCQKITEVAPDVIVESVGGGSVKLLSEASAREKPISPNLLTNTIKCSGIGFVFICGIICLITLLDNKVKKEEDLTKMGLALLGVIPTYDMED